MGLCWNWNWFHEEQSVLMVDCSQSGIFDVLVERFKAKTLSRRIVVQRTGILKQVSLSKIMTTVFHYNLQW